MSDDPSPPEDVLGALPRTRPQRSNARRDAARAKAAKPSAKPRTPAANGAAAPRPKPKAVKMPPPEPTPAPGRSDANPAELAAAAVRATGEIVELGGKVLKGMLSRLPRP